MPPLKNIQYENFCREYLKDFNAGEAYKRAGFKIKTDAGSRVRGSVMMKKPEIIERLAELGQEFQKKYDISEAEWVREVLNLARSNIKNVLRATEDGITMKPTDDMTMEEAAVIQSAEHNVTATAMSLKYKLPDKIKAYELLGRRMGIFHEKQDVNLTMSEDTKLALAAWERRKKTLNK